MIIARADKTHITDLNKRCTNLTLTKRSPAQDYIALCIIRDTDWSSVISQQDIQIAFDTLYSIISNIYINVFTHLNQ